MCPVSGLGTLLIEMVPKSPSKIDIVFVDHSSARQFIALLVQRFYAAFSFTYYFFRTLNALKFIHQHQPISSTAAAGYFCPLILITSNFFRNFIDFALRMMGRYINRNFISFHSSYIENDSFSFTGFIIFHKMHSFLFLL